MLLRGGVKDQARPGTEDGGWTQGGRRQTIDDRRWTFLQEGPFKSLSFRAHAGRGILQIVLLIPGHC